MIFKSLVRSGQRSSIFTRIFAPKRLIWIAWAKKWFESARNSFWLLCQARFHRVILHDPISLFCLIIILLKCFDILLFISFFKFYLLLLNHSLLIICQVQSIFYTVSQHYFLLKWQRWDWFDRIDNKRFCLFKIFNFWYLSNLNSTFYGHACNHQRIPIIIIITIRVFLLLRFLFANSRRDATVVLRILLKSRRTFYTRQIFIQTGQGW